MCIYTLCIYAWCVYILTYAHTNIYIVYTQDVYTLYCICYIYICKYITLVCVYVSCIICSAFLDLKDHIIRPRILKSFLHANKHLNRWPGEILSCFPASDPPSLSVKWGLWTSWSLKTIWMSYSLLLAGKTLARQNLLFMKIMGILFRHLGREAKILSDHKYEHHKRSSWLQRVPRLLDLSAKAQGAKYSWVLRVER